MTTLELERQASRTNPAMRRVVSITLEDTEGEQYTVLVEVGRGNFLVYSGRGDNRRAIGDVYEAFEHACLLARDALEYYDAQGILPRPEETAHDSETQDNAPEVTDVGNPRTEDR